MQANQGKAMEKNGKEWKRGKKKRHMPCPRNGRREKKKLASLVEKEKEKNKANQPKQR